MPNPASTPPAPPAQVPFLVADSYVLALDAFMRRTGQGGHVSQSVLELDGPPDLDRLRAGMRRAPARHPLLAAVPRRHLWSRLPYWEVLPPLAAGLPFGCWREGAIPAGRPFADATPTADWRELLRWLSGEGLTANGARCKARFDAVARREGKFALVLTWSHLLFDGKGAELFCAELARLCDGEDIPAEPPRPAAATRVRRSWWQKFRRTRPAMDYQTGLQETGAPSLGGPRPRAGGPNYQVVTFTPAETATIRTRAERLGGGLFPITFFIACVAQAQDRVFRHRGQRPAGYVICVPTQTRKRGAREPIFQNHVAPLFFNPRRAHLATVEETAAAMRSQFADMVRHKVAESFDAVLDLMRPLPDAAFLELIRAQYGGELCTCFSSHTGTFAVEETFAEARITNAYHLPCLGTPPGTGIFFGEHGERLSVTVSWRDGALTDEERSLMVAQLHDDLFGRERVP